MHTVQNAAFENILVAVIFRYIQVIQITTQVFVAELWDKSVVMVEGGGASS